ncbi:hypothetical protein [Endothiovibrio diazotrophicus]
MSDWLVPPWYYPSTLVAVDDEQGLLFGLEAALGDDYRFVACDTQRKAHEALAGGRPLGGAETSPEVFGNPRDPARHSVVSVMLVDYGLSGLTGIELIRGFGDHPARRILYSGMSDVGCVEEALREGVVDCFIAKHDPRFLDRLEEAVAVLSRRYFIEWGKAVATDAEGLLSSPEIAELLDGLARRHGCVEHYLFRDGGGFLLVDEGGGRWDLRVGGEPPGGAVTDEGETEAFGRWWLVA